MSDVRWPNHRSEVRNEIKEHLCAVAVAVAVDELRYYVVSSKLARVAT